MTSLEWVAYAEGVTPQAELHCGFCWQGGGGSGGGGSGIGDGGGGDGEGGGGGGAGKFRGGGEGGERYFLP